MKRVRIRLLHFLLGILFCCFVVIASTSVSQNHRIAVAKIRGLGYEYSSGFEDPIGPNWMWTGRSGLPTNGTFQSKYARFFCLVGCKECVVDNKQLVLDDLYPLPKLLHLKYLRFFSCDLPKGAFAIVSRCKYLRNLQLINTQIDDVASLEKLKVKSLTLMGIDLADERDALIKSLSKIDELELLFISDCGFSSEDSRLIRRSLPNCKVNPTSEDG